MVKTVQKLNTNATYERPCDTTANPNWHLAPTAPEIIPATLDRHGKGERMVNIISNFLITQGSYSGQRLGSVMLDWQRDFTRLLFGLTDDAGNRKIRRTFLKMGKGSGKSLFAAALALGVLMDSVARGVNHRGCIVVMSPSIATSRIIFGHLEAALMNDTYLTGQFKSKQIERALIHTESGIEIVVKVASMGQAIGLRPICIIFDEWHQMAVEGGTRIVETVDQLRKGMSNAGSEGLEIVISTAPPSVSTGIYSQLIGYARKVRDGHIVDESFLPVLFEPPIHKNPNLDMGNMEGWAWGMPSLRIGESVGTMDASELEREYDEAVRTGDPTAMGLFLSQRVGVEPADRRNVGGQLFQDLWDELPKCSMRPPRDASQLCIAFDPGGVNDLFAVAHCWRIEGDSTYYISVLQHMLASAYDRAPSANKTEFDKAIKTGELTVHDTNMAMLDSIIRYCNDVQSSMHIASPVFGGDAYGSAGWVSDFKEGTGADYIEVHQGYKLKAALLDFNAATNDFALAHPHSNLLTWNVRNLLVNDDASSGRIFQKSDSNDAGVGARKIDGIMAALSAFSMIKRNLGQSFPMIG